MTFNQIHGKSMLTDIKLRLAKILPSLYESQYNEEYREIFPCVVKSELNIIQNIPSPRLKE